MNISKKKPQENASTIPLEGYTPIPLAVLLEKLLALEATPARELAAISKLSRSTVRKFLHGLPIRTANTLSLMDASLEMIETRNRKVLKMKQKQESIAILEKACAHHARENNTNTLTKKPKKHT